MAKSPKRRMRNREIGKSKAKVPPLPRPPGATDRDVVPGYHLLAEDAESFDWLKIRRLRNAREKQPGNMKRRRNILITKRAYLRAQVARLVLGEFMASEIAQKLGISVAFVCELKDEALEQWRQSAVTDSVLAREKELRKVDFLWNLAFVEWEKSSKLKSSTTTKYERSAGESDGGGAAGVADEAVEAGAEQSPEDAKAAILEAAESAGINTRLSTCDKGGTKDKIALAAKCKQLANMVASEISVRKERQTGNAAYLAVMQWCIDMRVKILGLSKPQEIHLEGEFRVAGASAAESEREMLKMFVDRVRNLQQPGVN